MCTYVFFNCLVHCFPLLRYHLGRKRDDDVGAVSSSLYIQVCLVYRGSSVVKALPTCLYAGRWRCPGPVTFSVLLWDLAVPPCRSEVPRTQGATRHHHPPFDNKRETPHQPPATRLVFYIRVRVAFPRTNIWSEPRLKCKDVGLLNGTPRSFLHGSFCMKKKRRLFYTQI